MNLKIAELPPALAEQIKEQARQVLASPPMMDLFTAEGIAMGDPLLLLWAETDESITTAYLGVTGATDGVLWARHAIGAWEEK